MNRFILVSPPPGKASESVRPGKGIYGPERRERGGRGDQVAEENSTK